MITHFPVKFGEYTLQNLIGRGGMAEVYRATKAGIGGFEKPVAIKMILPHLSENEEFITMLTDEARIIVSFSHANIAQVYDFCRNAGRYFIAMEYVHGIDVAELNQRMGRLGERVAVEHSVYIALCMCSGLNYAHNKVDAQGKSQGVVHRDVSPQNILLSYAGEVKIIDFGVAKARNRDASTQAGVIKGKLHYMAPEQAKGEGIDGRADIFAAGIVLYELLTGRLPFDGETEFEIYNNLMNGHVIPPSTFNGQVPDELDMVVMKMLERDISKRYASGYEAKQELEQILHHIAPGYTNTRLSRYIEMMVERERNIQPIVGGQLLDVSPADFPEVTTDATESPPFEIEFDEAEEDKEPTVTEQAPDDFDEPKGGYPSESEEQRQPRQRTVAPIPAGRQTIPTPMMPGRPGSFDSDFSLAEFPPIEEELAQGSGFNSMPALVFLSILGILIVAGAAFGTFYFLAPRTAPQPKVVSANFQVTTPLADHDGNAPVIRMVVDSHATEPAPSVALHFTSNPSGASVQMDGDFVGKTPLLLYLDKSEKTSIFTFSADNYADSTLELVPSEETTQTVTLVKEKSEKADKGDRADRGERPYRSDGFADDQKKHSPKKEEKKSTVGKKSSGTGLIDPFGM